MNLTDLLEQHFPYKSFRGQQEQILNRILSGHHSLVLMPTGMGKSLCYQFPAKTQQGLVLVVSPLIALMQDQVTKAKELGIAATFLNSSLDREERERRQKHIHAGQYQLLFVTPERFRKPEFWQAIEGRQIQLFAIDEAHCISHWGHDFRPDYSRLGEFRARLGNPVTLALTATATPSVQADILKQLRLEDQAQILTAGLERSNLSLNVHEVYQLEDKVRHFVSLQAQTPGAGIVYFSLIDTLKKFSRELVKLNIEHIVYHGDLPPHLRRQNQKRFIQAEKPLMLATPAFGLGIDKANIRCLVHAELPGSLEAYFQEVGRAGRDGAPASCHLLYDEDDVSIQMEFLKWSHPEPEFIRKVYLLIETRRGQVDQEGFDFLRSEMSFKNRRDFRVEAAVNILERWGCLDKADQPFPFVCVQMPTDEMFSQEDPKELLKNQNQKLLEMVRWASQSEVCRLNKVYEYFGFIKNEPCGICDVCKQG